jgi:hypothetical protein
MDKYENRAMELESGIAAFETKNFAHAIKLLSPIAEEGNNEALYRMAIMLQNGLGCQINTEKAFDYINKAAENNYALAQHALGFMFFEGECANQNIEKSIEWYTKVVAEPINPCSAALVNHSILFSIF